MTIDELLEAGRSCHSLSLFGASALVRGKKRRATEDGCCLSDAESSHNQWQIPAAKDRRDAGMDCQAFQADRCTGNVSKNDGLRDFNDMTDVTAICVDDIVVHSKYHTEHLDRLRRVLDRLLQEQLMSQAREVRLCTTEIT